MLHKWITCFLLCGVISIALSADYRVDVTTVENQDGGPDSVTYVTVVGTKGTLQRSKLPTGVREARLDTLPINKAKDIGVVCRINLESESVESWFVGTVFIRINDEANRTQLFTFNQWITEKSTIHRYHKVHGGWQGWSEWTTCQAKCYEKGTQLRKRSCDQPQPGCGGEQCIGETRQTRTCTNLCEGSEFPRPGETRYETDILPWIIAVAVCGVIILILLIVLIALCCVFKRKNRHRKFTHTSSPGNPSANNRISFISNGNATIDERVQPILAQRQSSTYASSSSAADKDSGIGVRTRHSNKSDRKRERKERKASDDSNFNEQNNCVDYVYYTYNYNGKGKDTNGNAPMFVPCDGKTGRPIKSKSKNHYETNATEL